MATCPSTGEVLGVGSPVDSGTSSTMPSNQHASAVELGIAAQRHQSSLSRWPKAAITPVKNQATYFNVSMAMDEPVPILDDCRPDAKARAMISAFIGPPLSSFDHGKYANAQGRRQRRPGVQDAL